METLLSAVIPLTAQNTPASQTYLGRACYAWFLRQVARADADLAETLHAVRTSKPFTVSAVRSWEQPRDPLPEVLEGRRYFLRVTSLEERISRCLLDSVLPGLEREARLGPVTFRVGEPITGRERHFWARTTGAEELLATWMECPEGCDRTFTLEFASPCAVRRIRREVLVPLPEVVFLGYWRAWNAYGCHRLAQDLRRLVGSEVAISRYRLHTLGLDLGKGRTRGWAGRCEYTIFAPEAGVRRLIHLLADFSQFCGTGYKTTQGMGQTRLLKKPSENADC